MLNVFVSGLQRQSGKTLVTAGLAATMQSLSYSTSVYKPIQTGAVSLGNFRTSPDLAFIKRIDSNIATHSTYLLKSKASPFVSSYEDGLKVDLNTIYSEFQGLKLSDCSIVEGSNSISTPVAKNFTEADIVKALRIPMVLVVNAKSTPMADVISGLRYIYSERVDFLGVIINQYDENSQNLEEKYYPQILKEFCDVKVLGTLPDYGEVNSVAPEILIADVLTNINIEEVFGLKIAKLNS
jgi:dethiobiotin synthetase